jgi:hypothetical protein
VYGGGAASGVYGEGVSAGVYGEGISAGVYGEGASAGTYGSGAPNLAAAPKLRAKKSAGPYSELPLQKAKNPYQDLPPAGWHPPAMGRMPPGGMMPNMMMPPPGAGIAPPPGWKPGMPMPNMQPLPKQRRNDGGYVDIMGHPGRKPVLKAQAGRQAARPTQPKQEEEVVVGFGQMPSASAATAKELPTGGGGGIKRDRGPAGASVYLGFSESDTVENKGTELHVQTEL